MDGIFIDRTRAARRRSGDRAAAWMRSIERAAADAYRARAGRIRRDD